MAGNMLLVAFCMFISEVSGFHESQVGRDNMAGEGECSFCCI